MRSILKQTTTLIAFLALVASCDSADPSFVVSDAENPETQIQKAQGDDAIADGSANRPQTASFGDSDQRKSTLEIYKDNANKEKRSVPSSLLSADTQELDEDKKVSEFSSSFAANEISDGQLSLDLKTLSQETTLTMRKMAETKEVNDRQVNRRNVSDSGVQGHDPSQISESFDQQESGLSDILIVIDDSGSMGNEQAKVAANLPALLSRIKDSNWRITVVTTYDGTHRGTISKGDVDAEQKFANAINVGASGRGNEKGIQYAKEGLDIKLADNSSWLRADSSVSVLIISDEDNCSNQGSGCGTNAWASPSYLINHLAAIRPDASNPAKVYGIIWHPDMPKAQCSTAHYQGVHYAQAIDATGGAWGSICSEDYSSVLNGISDNIGDQLRTQFSLSHKPLAGTVVVTVLDASQNPVTVPYTLNDKTLTFTQAPPYGSTINVRYSYGGEPIKRSFNLSARPAAETLAVTIETQAEDGTKNVVAADAASYDIVNDGGQYKVMFNEGMLPAQRSKIAMNYREYQALKKEIAIPCSFIHKADSVVVKSGTDTIDAKYYSVNFSAKKVVFDKGFVPSDNDLFAVSYACYAKVLSYEYQTSDSASDLYVYRKSNKEEVPFSLESNAMTFAEALWSDGQEIIVRNTQKLNMALGTQITMTHSPIAASISAKLGSMSCSGSELKVDGSNLDLSACGFEKAEGQVVIDYKYVSQTNLMYSINKDLLAVNHDTRVFLVKVDGVVVTDYEVKDNQIIFPANAIAKDAKTIELQLTLMVREQ